MDTLKTNPDREYAEHIISLSGGYQKAVDLLMVLNRAMWDLGFTGDDEKREKRRFRMIDEKLLRRKFAELSARLVTPAVDVDGQLLSATFSKLASAKIGLCHEFATGEMGFHVRSFYPYELARTLLADIKPEYELRYFIMRNIRRTHNCVLSSHLIRLFYLMANAINAEMQPVKSINAGSSSASKFDHVWNYKNKFLALLENALSEAESGPINRTVLNAFIESCRAVGYIVPHYRSNQVALKASTIDVDYLISNLFGMPTDIRGFDDLFGGGGLLIAEGGERGERERLNGRTVLIKGRFGTGKSLLSMQLAVEVARKGGIAYLMPLEQSAEECLYTLESMRVLPKDMNISIATDLAAAVKLMDRHTSDADGSGALIILSTIKDSFKDFLTVFAEEAKQLRGYGLRLVCVDPINSVVRTPDIHVTEMRAEMHAKFKEIEESGVNILLVAEEESEKDELRFEENIADTVIYLTVKKRHDYSQRYIEVAKSRLQREQPGLHPFSIVSGVGFSIYPTSASFSSKIRSRSLPLNKIPVEFGQTSIDDKLGEAAILGGDVIAFYGPAGALKSSLGLLFLLEADTHHKNDADGQKNHSQADDSLDKSKEGRQLEPVSLLISTRDNEFTFRHMLTPYRAGRNKKVNICTLPTGFITPGHIMQRLEDEFSKMRNQEYNIDRVMIDGVAHWEMSCPFVREDDTFADTLLDYLRRRGVTSLLVCGQPSVHPSSVLQRTVIDGADCVVEFERIEFRGESRVRAKILKTRSMKHRRESFDLTIGPRTLEVTPMPSLLREASGGEIKPIKVSIFMHAETTAQKKIYNERLKQQIKSLLSPDTEVHQQDRIQLGDETNLRASSTVDELQIFQLDEFQVPNSADVEKPNFPLHIFPASQWEEEWNDLLPRLKSRVRAKGDRFFAVPYYENLSLLAYRRDRAGDAERFIGSWRDMARVCEEWEKEHPDPKDVFFDFPKVTVENYTCLFWEILLSIKGLPQNQAECGIRSWLQSREAIEAGKIYRRLCRRSYLSDPNNRVLIIHQRENLTSTIDVNPRAVVWRHWYSTLNQMLSQVDLDTRNKIKVVALPGEITTAGEWYWAIPAHSAAPEVGLQVIKTLTTRTKELDRLQQGIGLPTRASFYRGLTESRSAEVDISSYFSINPQVLERLAHNAFKRSDCGFYSQFFDSTARHLQNIIEIPEVSEDEIEAQIYKAFETFRTSVLFTRSTWSCHRCRSL